MAFVQRCIWFYRWLFLAVRLQLNASPFPKIGTMAKTTEKIEKKKTSTANENDD